MGWMRGPFNNRPSHSQPLVMIKQLKIQAWARYATPCVSHLPQACIFFPPIVPCTLYLVTCTLYLVPCNLYLVPCNLYLVLTKAKKLIFQLWDWARIDWQIHEGHGVVVVVFLACSTLGKTKKLNNKLWLRSSENLLKIHEGPGVVVLCFWPVAP